MIRKATFDDVPTILGFYKAGLKELGEDYVEAYASNKVVNSLYLAPCFLLEVNDIVSGMAAFTMVTTSHTGVATLSDYMFYVQPEHRNIDNLSGLIEAAKGFADETGLPIRIETLTDNDEYARKRLFKMHDFKVFSVVGVYG